MMIWLFGVSLFHLSFAARSELRVKSVLLYILLGLVINLILMAFALIPYTSFFSTITQSVMDQINILIAIYIAKRNFFPAMNSRIIDAFHYNNVRVYLEQKRLLYRYKVLICFLTFTFEIYILKNLILYNLFVIFELISVYPCWLHVTLHFPVFLLVYSTNYLLHQISFYFQIFGHLTNVIVYINIILVNLILTSAHTLARSLHDVSRANNNRFAVVVCFRLAFHASGMPIFLEIFEFKIFKNFVTYDDVIIR